MYRSQGFGFPDSGNLQALRESRRNDRSVCSLKYKNGFIFRHDCVCVCFFFFFNLLTAVFRGSQGKQKSAARGGAQAGTA